MKKPPLENGFKNNKLTVISMAYKDSKGRTYYLFKCDCGKEKIVQGSQVKQGTTKSCGCFKKECSKQRLLPDNRGVKNAIILGYKRHAKDRGINFNLSYEEVSKIVCDNCYYCGTLPSNLKITKNCKKGFSYNGIDRIDSSKDYDIKNCVACCKKCNLSKNYYSVEEFLDWITKVYDFSIAKNKK